MSTAVDPLARFVQAQRLDYDTALAELRAGRKRSHWIWYVLPQLRALGRSERAREYGLSGGDEARRYLAHPVLGPRLIECVNALLPHAGSDIKVILGEVDALKFRSCLTLFAAVAPHEACFDAALRAFYAGVPDSETLRLLHLEPTTPHATMPERITPDAVVQFLHHFEEVAMQEDFSLLQDMIDKEAYFRFNDGDFVGRAAIQAAFEMTWKGDPSVKKARFYLSDIVVLTTDQASATATYTYHWEGSQGERAFTIQGRGTRVLVCEGGRFRIVHEHLSRFPAPRKA